VGGEGPRLHCAEVGLELLGREVEAVAGAELGHEFGGRGDGLRLEGASRWALAGEDIHHRADGVGLEGLCGVEKDLHAGGLLLGVVA
jgi:hypothetical protein